MQHGHVLGTDAVEVIPLEGNRDCTGKGFFGCRKVQKRQLKSDRAVEVVEEVTPALKKCRLVLVLRELIVDVLELDGLGVMAVRQAAKDRNLVAISDYYTKDGYNAMRELLSRGCEFTAALIKVQATEVPINQNRPNIRNQHYKSPEDIWYTIVDVLRRVLLYQKKSVCHSLGIN